METRRLSFGRLTIALHRLRDAPGPNLLLLHGSGGSSSAWVVDGALWPGSVWALDFAGHGESEWMPGGGYSPELFAAEADRALEEIGPALVAGVGLGAYVALLLAGARPDRVGAALLLPGAGLDGSGAAPDAEAALAGLEAELAQLQADAASPGSGSDPLASFPGGDIRPPAYARAFAARARRLVLAHGEEPTPPWWQGLAGAPNVSLVACDADAITLAGRHLATAALPTEPTRG